MKRALLLGFVLVGLFALAPMTASADTCHDRCDCAPSEQDASPGSTKGCISPQNNTVSVCGNAGAAPAQGCVCVNGTCLNNMGSGANTVSQGCPNSVPCK